VAPSASNDTKTAQKDKNNINWPNKAKNGLKSHKKWSQTATKKPKTARDNWKVKDDKKSAKKSAKKVAQKVLTILLFSVSRFVPIKKFFFLIVSLQNSF
jgi:hypothetical protein